MTERDPPIWLGLAVFVGLMCAAVITSPQYIQCANQHPPITAFDCILKHITQKGVHVAARNRTWAAWSRARNDAPCPFEVGICQPDFHA